MEDHQKPGGVGVSPAISQRKRFGIVAALCVLLLLLIVPAKWASFTGGHTDGATSSDSALLDDTTFVHPSLPDSAIMGDDRPVDRAGFEDGYTSGSTDAAMRQGRGTYDEQNPYPSGERSTYIEGYREGYRQGQAFGHDHPSTDARRDRRSIDDRVRESDERLK